jgi:hypothetical protein
MVPDNAGNTVRCWLFINMGLYCTDFLLTGLYCTDSLLSNQLSLKNVQKLYKYDSNGIIFHLITDLLFILQNKKHKIIVLFEPCIIRNNWFIPMSRKMVAFYLNQNKLKLTKLALNNIIFFRCCWAQVHYVCILECLMKGTRGYVYFDRKWEWITLMEK